MGQAEVEERSGERGEREIGRLGDYKGRTDEGTKGLRDEETKIR